MKVSGKDVLITGASQGIGGYLAVHFARQGARVILTARNEENLKKTAARVEEAGGACLVQPSDLCEPSSLERLAEVVREKVGGVDLLINNAADLTSKPFLETSLGEIDTLIRTNVTGGLQLTRLVAPMMAERGGGMIVNFSSLAGYKANPTQTVYSISKTGVNGMSEGLRAEFRCTGIRVMNVAVCSVAVDKPPVGGQIPVEQFARQLDGAIAGDADELYLSVVTKWLMRLYKFFPKLVALRP